MSDKFKFDPEAATSLEKEANIDPVEKPARQRASVDAANEIRALYAALLEGRSLGYEVISEMMHKLESCESWPEFAQEQGINPLRIDPGSPTEKLMTLAIEYYKLRTEEDKTK